MKKTIWLLLDDRKGSVNQAQGIAQAIGDRLNIIEKKLVYNRWASLPNWIRGKTLLGVDQQKSDCVTEDFPEAVLSAASDPYYLWLQHPQLSIPFQLSYIVSEH